MLGENLPAQGVAVHPVVGNRTETAYGNDTAMTYGYDDDPRWRLEDIGYNYPPQADGGYTQEGTLHLTRDDVGNPLTWGDLGATYTRDYGYDENNRLDAATYPNINPISYAYDWAGNRNPSTVTYNAADQMTAGYSHTYVYDGRGNLTTVDSTSNIQYHAIHHPPL